MQGLPRFDGQAMRAQMAIASSRSLISLISY